jgi:CheY-like chemotaxis protein
MNPELSRGPCVDAPPVETILVVDDDRLMREAIEAVLSSAGYRVLLAKDGIEALEKYLDQSGAIAMVLMDVTMPRLGGIEATRRIREIDPGAKIVLSSGCAEQSVSSAKPCAFLPKPYGAATLKTMVSQVLRAG